MIAILEVLLWKRVDPEIRHACNEVLDHLGIPHSEIDHFKSSTTTNDEMRRVLILPESSDISAEDIETLIESAYSIISTGNIPPDLAKNLNCSIVGMAGNNPPSAAGFLRIDGIGEAPFFYEFPVLELKGVNLRRFGEIRDDYGAKVGAVLGKRNAVDFALFAPQLFRSVSYFLAGSEATFPKESMHVYDGLGRIEGRKTEIFKRGFLQIPVVNIYENFLLRTFLEFSNIRKRILVRKWFYPKNHDMAVCMSHDVDGLLKPDLVLDMFARLKRGNLMAGLAAGFLGLNALMSMVSCRLHLTTSKNPFGLVPLGLARKLMCYNPLWNFPNYISIEKQFGGHSAFFFLNNSSAEDSDYDFLNPLIVEAITFLKESEWEVGLHASFNSCLDVEKIRGEKSLLERVVGEQVFGVTQHFLRLSIPETWLHQESTGLLYDSSLGFHDVVGFRAGSCLPFHPLNFKTMRAISILEIPLIIMDGTLFQKVHMNLSADKAFNICSRIADTVYKYNGVLGLQWHHSVDREKEAAWFSLYRMILSHCSKFNAWYASGRQMAEWWNLRRSASFKHVESSSMAKFCIQCPKGMKGFSIGVYAPDGCEIEELYINAFSLEEKNIVRKGSFSLFSLNLLRGENQLEIHFSRSPTNAHAKTAS